VRLRELRAQGWRNLEPLSFVPGPRVNVLFGDNGQGKTNLIEALGYVATLGSHRVSTEPSINKLELYKRLINNLPGAIEIIHDFNVIRSL